MKSNRLLPNKKIKLIEGSFATLSDRADELAGRFFNVLFEQHPGLTTFFDNVDPDEQRQNLVSALHYVVTHLRKPKLLSKVLTDLGKRHEEYSAAAEHYPLLVEILLDVMEEFAGDLWTDKVHQAWKDGLDSVTQIMFHAYEQVESTNMAKSKKDKTAQLRVEIAHLNSIVAAVNSPLVTIDNDFVVTHMNEPAKELLNKREAVIAAEFPGFRADQVIGTSIEKFWRVPVKLQQKWSTADNLPYSCNFTLGTLRISMTVSAQADQNGVHDGNVLEIWDYTDQYAKDIEVARLQSAVNGAQANLMLCNEELKITYLNPSLVQMFTNRQTELRQIWPGFDAHNLVGECIDQYHQNPAQQRALLGDTSSLPATEEIKIGELDFRINVTAILNPKKKYMGNMVEWQDLTEQKDAERQIANLISAASQGELNERIETERYQGFMCNLSEGINQLLNAVVEPIQASTNVLDRLANGDLTELMTGEFQGQFSVMQAAVNTSINNLQDMVHQIQDASSNISTSASEIAQGNSDLSQRTEQQAASLQETASSMEELTSTVCQNAENSRQANTLAASARDQAEGGGEVVHKAVAAMGEINAASKKISDIIGVIDEIAFQTNLLALNAAVEAARAGEQGRGFAVVASEVRNLAQRSAEAAKEIKTLINDSVAKVEEGSRLVDQSGSTLEEIVTSVKKVSDIIAEITAASDEQSSGIEQVNKAVTQMDQMTQQNAALVEQAAAASESMDEQSSGLIKLLEFFKADQASSHATAPLGKNERRSDRRPLTGKPAVSSNHTQSGWSNQSADRPKRANVASVKAVAHDSEWEEF